MSEYPEYIKQLLQLVLAPARGWEDIESAAVDPSRVSARLMMPSFVLAGASVIGRMLFLPELTLGQAALGAVVAFVAFFVSFAISVHAFATRLGKYVEESDKERNLTVITYTMTLLALSAAVCNFTPVPEVLQLILALLIGVVAWRSAAILGVKPDKEISFAGFAMGYLALPPVIIQLAFAWLMTKA